MSEKTDEKQGQLPRKGNDTVSADRPYPEVDPEEPKCSYCGQPQSSCGGNCWAMG